MIFTNMTSSAMAGMTLRKGYHRDDHDALQSAQSGIAQYEAGSGFKHLDSINREWAGFASLRYRRLPGDRADSPIVASLGNRDQVSAGIGVKCRF